MTYTAEEVADLLDRAHDEMLVRGWAQGHRVDDEGRVCIYGAINIAATGDPVRCGSLLAEEANMRMTIHLGRGPANWNDDPDRTEDEVFEAFRLAAKQLRNGKCEPWFR